ncbi:MAG: SDR family oxidoreductase [Proteobacteria bacterium]|nr:SDR family oxidoreductase [Pseudomonadota bacterium]
MDIDLTEKVVLVTGASRGIGRAIAKQFSQSGATVIVHYHKNHKAAKQTLAELSGGPHRSVQADLSDPGSILNMTQVLIEDMGRIDILVNNAGICEESSITDLTFEEWQDIWTRTILTNLVGPANLSFCLVRHMMENGGGKIVNVSSRGAFRGEPDAPAYGASKAGLNALSQSLAKALAPYEVFLYVVAPGYVETEMTAHILSGPTGDSIRNQSPLGRVAQADEIARTVVFLASEGTEYLTGCIVDINGASYLRS